MSGLRVIKAGPLSLLQDGGRHGWQHLGVSPSGPMDRHAAAWANRLLENAPTAPLLEIALGGVELESLGDTWLALCGAELPIQLDGVVRPNWSRFRVHAGQRLRLGFARSGQRAYLAIAGGFRVEPVLGSVACQAREGLGGLDGRGARLADGDLLQGGGGQFARGASVPWPWQPDYRSERPLRVMLGGDAALFAPSDVQSFFAQPWQLSPQSDRMGARLKGEPLSPPKRQWSLGVVRGTVQVPPDGQPIILQADHQTMGGYPIFGWLHPRDCDRLAQCSAHQTLRFEPVDIPTAQADLRQFRRFFEPAKP